jgi:molecular chaperone Hsp33
MGRRPDVAVSVAFGWAALHWRGMSETESSLPVANGAAVTVSFVRRRNVLLAQADLGPLFVDYYLHLADHGLRPEPTHEGMFKEALTAFVLHCASRPMLEHIAWTINFQQPRLNVFLVGDNEDCAVAGRIFTRHVREAEQGVFHSDVVPRRGAQSQRSVVNFGGGDPWRAAEIFYTESEQRLVRFFPLGEDNYAMLGSHPDCDKAWLRQVDAAGVRELARTETLAVIERRSYRWQCGCNQAKILGAIAPAFRDDPQGMFGDQESIRVQCPRCAAQHVVTREAMEAWVARRGKGNP